MQNNQVALPIEQSYLDFELAIGLGGARQYPVTVIHSPAGEARETMYFPFEDSALEGRLKDLQIALLRSGDMRRRVLSSDEQTVQDFGRALFDALLTGEVRSRYDVSQQQATQQGKGVRFKLCIQAPELALLPWEFLYDSRQDEYVCLHRTPIIRYIQLPQPIRSLAVALPLRILGMIASPGDQPSLNVDREKSRVEQAIQHLRTKGLVHLTWLEGQTWRDLQRAMRRGPWHVYHFIGHGGFDSSADEGFICLADEQGQTEYFRATQLARLLGSHDSLRLVLLNACEGARSSRFDVFSSIAATLVRRGIPAVLAMQYEITDRAAIEFSRAFYESLADGLPVDAAVTEARKAVSLAIANSIEWGIPALYMRSPDGLLFSIQKQVELPYQAEAEGPLKDYLEHINQETELSVPDEQILPISETVRMYYDRIQYLFEHLEGLGLPTGFVDLDRFLVGLPRSELTIVAGRPGAGKTSLLLSICLNAAHKFHQRVAIFTLEMSSEQITEHLMSQYTGIDIRRLHIGDIREEEWDRFVQATSDLSDMRVYIEDTLSMSVLQFCAKASQFHVKHGLDLIVVDYLQLMQSGVQHEDRLQEISYITRELKLLARTLGIPVLVASQISHAIEQRNDRRPVLGDLGSVGEYADAVLFIYRKDLYSPQSEYTNTTELIVAKQQHGPTGIIELHFDERQTRFTNLPRSDPDSS